MGEYIWIFSGTVQSLNTHNNKRLQVAYTHAQAYMWAPVPQGSQWYFCVLYIPDVNMAM